MDTTSTRAAKRNLTDGAVSGYRLHPQNLSEPAHSVNKPLQHFSPSGAVSWQ